MSVLLCAGSIAQSTAKKGTASMVGTGVVVWMGSCKVKKCLEADSNGIGFMINGLKTNLCGTKEF